MVYYSTVSLGNCFFFDRQSAGIFFYSSQNHRFEEKFLMRGNLDFKKQKCRIVFIMKLLTQNVKLGNILEFQTTKKRKKKKEKMKKIDKFLAIIWDCNWNDKGWWEIRSRLKGDDGFLSSLIKQSLSQTTTSLTIIVATTTSSKFIINQSESSS